MTDPSALRRRFEALSAIRLGGELTPHAEDDIAAFEATLDAPLPDDYRALLATLGGSIAFDADVVYTPLKRSQHTTKDGTQSIIVLYGLHGDAHDLRKMEERYSERIASSFLPIAETPGGNQLCLGLTKPHRGRVFLWDHEDERDVSGRPDLGNMSLAARSFSEFIAALEVREEKPIPDEKRAIGIQLDPSLFKID